MRIPATKLIDMPVMSLQTGTELARTTRAIIDPADLRIYAYELAGKRLGASQTLLMIADIRELSDIGIIVDSSDELIEPGDVIQINDIYSLHFNILDMEVQDEKKQKVGKVIDYAIETNSFTIEQLTVKPPLLRSFNESELLIHRSQIIEINPKAIVINRQAKLRNSIDPEFINPFRKNKKALENTSLRE